MSTPKLTPREREVLSRVARGLENRQIGNELGISEQAVKDHVSVLLEKFHVANRAGLTEAALLLEFTGSSAIEHGWARQFFQGAELQICVLSGPEFRYATVNEAFRRAIGGRDVIGRTIREAFPEFAGPDALERLERVYRTGVPSIENAATRRWDRGQGIEEGRVTLVIQPLRDDEGNVNGLIAYAIDVTPPRSGPGMPQIASLLVALIPALATLTL